MLERGRIAQTWRDRWDVWTPSTAWASRFTKTAQAPAVPGLYFCGVHFLRKRKSSLLMGVGEDAAIVARSIAARHTG